MPDIVDPETRSRMMAGIRGTDTKPEMMLRRALHARGFRYRLHAKHLPGKRNMVFPRHRAVIFAHGCFWHGHDCPLFRMPGTRREFWEAKIARNRERDAEVAAALLEAGWRVGIVWECCLRGQGKRSYDEVFDTCEDWINGSDRSMYLRGIYEIRDAFGRI